MKTKDKAKKTHSEPLTAPPPTATIPVEHAQLKLSALMPPLANPRTNFPPAEMDELEASFTARGFTDALSQLLVRPIEYRGGRDVILSSGAVINGLSIEFRFPGGEWKPVSEAHRRDMLSDAPFINASQKMNSLEEVADVIALLPTHEIVDGERRYRVATKLGIETAPAAIALLTDDQALELQLVSAIQRASLSAIDEAEGICRLLELKDADGKPLQTVESLALKLGKSAAHISDCRGLRRLRGTDAGAAVENGTLTARHGKAIARIPTQALRDELTVLALKGSAMTGPGPLTAVQLEDLVRKNFTTELRGSQFDQAAENLVVMTIDDATGERTGGGACGDCPFNSKNAATAAGEKAGKFAMCMNLECHRKKCDAAYQLWADATAKPGVEVLTREQGQKLLDYTGKKIASHSGNSSLGDGPPDWILDDGVKNTKTWKALLRGAEVPIRTFKTGDGAVFEIVRTDLAIAAAIKNGHDIFEKDRAEDAQESAVNRAADEGDVEAKARQAQAAEDRKNALLKQQRAREIEQRMGLALTKALLQAVKSVKKPGREFWELLLAPMIESAHECDALDDVAKLLGCALPETADWRAEKQAVEKFIDAAPLEHLPALAMLLAQSMTYHDAIEAWEKKAFKTFAVDVKAVRKTELQQIEREETASREAEAIEKGLNWITKREKAAEFEWDAGKAVNPDVCEVALPEGVKAEVSLFAARCKTGWRAGFKITSKKHGSAEEAVDMNPPDYSSRELAIAVALPTVRAHFVRAKVPEAVTRIEAYIERLRAPEPPAEKAGKGAKKKGKK